MPEPKIISISQKKCVGKQLAMSMAIDKTQQLWQSMMPFRHQILNKVGSDLISLQVFPEGYFTQFNPTMEFQKWALQEVTNFEFIPENMTSFVLNGGLYAVFTHIGMDKSIFKFIYTEWIPNSDYIIDNRPHFEVLGAKYKNCSSQSEEEIWIPIVKKR